MSRSPRHRTIVFTAALLAAVAATAQEPATADRPASGAPTADLFSDAISVELVNVEVFVTDRSGEPVLDLQPGDFRIYADGREVDLTHFSLVRPAAAAGAARGGDAPAVATGSVEVPVQEPEPARIVVFLDLLHTGPSSRLRLAPSLARALDREMRPGDQVMVVAYDGSLDVVQPFTADQGKIRQALQGLAPITGNQLQSQYANQRALEAVRLSQMVESSMGAEGGADGTCVAIGGLAEPYADQAYHHVQQTIDALTGFVDSLAGLGGRKVLLHVSDGIPLVPGGQLLSYAIELCDGTGAAQGIDYAIDVTVLGDKQRHRWDPFAAKQRLNELDTTRDWQRLAAHANIEQVSFYPVQAAGLSSTRLVDAATDIQMTGRTLTFGVRNRQDTLDLIARETGGRATLNSNDPGLGVEGALADSRTHYLLAFKPASTKLGAVHRIRVEVDRPALEVRHRKSYRTRGIHEQVTNGVLTALFYGEVTNPLEAGLLHASGPRLEDGRRKVRLRVLIPLTRLTLLPRDEQLDGLFTVFVAARDEEGNTTPVRQVSIPVSVPAGSVSEDFGYDVEMTLDAGPHDVAVGVRDELGGTTAYLRGEVPAHGTG